MKNKTWNVYTTCNMFCKTCDGTVEMTLFPHFCCRGTYTERLLGERVNVILTNHIFPSLLNAPRFNAVTALIVGNADIIIRKYM